MNINLCHRTRYREYFLYFSKTESYEHDGNFLTACRSNIRRTIGRSKTVHRHYDPINKSRESGVGDYFCSVVFSSVA